MAWINKEERGEKALLSRQAYPSRVSQSVRGRLVVPSIPGNKQRAPLSLYPPKCSRARICRWLAERLAVYQESRQVKRKRDKAERRKKGHKREQTREEREMGGERGRKGAKRGNARRKREREREREKKDGGVGTRRVGSSTWSLLRGVSFSSALSVAFERFRTECPSSLPGVIRRSSTSRQT